MRHDSLKFEKLHEQDEIDLNLCLMNLEVLLIHRALERAQGSRTRAAGFLNINRTTLVAKMKSYGFALDRVNGYR